MLIARSALRGSTAVPVSVVNTWPLLNSHIACSESLDSMWLTLTGRRSPTVAGEGGTSRRERSALGLPTDPGWHKA